MLLFSILVIIIVIEQNTIVNTSNAAVIVTGLRSAVPSIQSYPSGLLPLHFQSTRGWFSGSVGSIE